MKVLVVKKKPALNGASGSCRHCKRSIKTGDVAFHQKMPSNPYGDRDMFFHVSCLAKLLEEGVRANEKVAMEAHAVFEESLAKVRERIIETGDPFVDC